MSLSLSNPLTQAETAASARGYADFEARSFENPYRQTHMRRAWQVGFNEAAMEFRIARRGRIDDHQRAVA